MDIMIWLGAAITLVGLALLIWCILRVMKARRAGLDEDGLRTELQRIVPLNTGALLLSICGLILVVMGIVLG